MDERIKAAITEGKEQYRKKQEEIVAKRKMDSIKAHEEYEKNLERARQHIDKVLALITVAVAKGESKLHISSITIPDIWSMQALAEVLNTMGIKATHEHGSEYDRDYACNVSWSSCLVEW